MTPWLCPTGGLNFSIVGKRKVWAGAGESQRVEGMSVGEKKGLGGGVLGTTHGAIGALAWFPEPTLRRQAACCGDRRVERDSLLATPGGTKPQGCVPRVCPPRRCGFGYPTKADQPV